MGSLLKRKTMYRPDTFELIVGTLIVACLLILLGAVLALIMTPVHRRRRRVVGMRRGATATAYWIKREGDDQ